MTGLLILKQMYNLGDETLIPEWVRDSYFQYFCGAAEFQWQYPCDPSDLVNFRKRIGEQGIEKIFAISVKMQGKDLKSMNLVPRHLLPYFQKQTSLWVLFVLQVIHMTVKHLSQHLNNVNVLQALHLNELFLTMDIGV